jgi:precorrin-6B methylase 2
MGKVPTSAESAAEAAASHLQQWEQGPHRTFMVNVFSSVRYSQDDSVNDVGSGSGNFCIELANRMKVSRRLFCVMTR